MIIRFEDRDWQFDLAHVRVQQAMVIQLYTGLSIGDWEDSLDFEADEQGNIKNPPASWLKSIVALYWLMRSQNGVTEPIDSTDFEYALFLVAFAEGTAAELERLKAEAAAKPDPTSSPSFPLGDPLSPAPVSPTAMTPMLPVPQEGDPATAYTPPATWDA